MFVKLAHNGFAKLRGRFNRFALSIRPLPHD